MCHHRMKLSFKKFHHKNEGFWQLFFSSCGLFVYSLSGCNSENFAYYHLEKIFELGNFIIKREILTAALKSISGRLKVYLYN